METDKNRHVPDNFPQLHSRICLSSLRVHAVCGNGIRFAGDVVTQRFTLNCADWKDDGFDPPPTAPAKMKTKRTMGTKRRPRPHCTTNSCSVRTESPCL